MGDIVFESWQFVINLIPTFFVMTFVLYLFGKVLRK